MGRLLCDKSDSILGAMREVDDCVVTGEAQIEGSSSFALKDATL